LAPNGKIRRCCKEYVKVGNGLTTNARRLTIITTAFNSYQ